MRNSTIISKKKVCKRCGRTDYIFSKGRCKQCSTIESTMERMEAHSESEVERDGLSDLIKIADEVYSKWLRMSSANESGIVSCYTCGVEMRWQDSHCGHFVKRGNLFLRFDPRNTKVQGPCCNIYKDGNYPAYTRRLEEDHPGITQILYEEGLVVYKPSKEEIRAIINEYRLKLKQLNK